MCAVGSSVLQRCSNRALPDKLACIDPPVSGCCWLCVGSSSGCDVGCGVGCGVSAEYGSEAHSAGWSGLNQACTPAADMWRAVTHSQARISGSLVLRLTTRLPRHLSTCFQDTRLFMADLLLPMPRFWYWIGRRAPCTSRSSASGSPPWCGRLAMLVHSGNATSSWSCVAQEEQVVTCAKKSRPRQARAALPSKSQFGSLCQAA